MNTQFILLTQSATSAMIEIALLLLGAALIGFLIAWFFQKSVFTPIVNRLESEKAELNRKIDSLNNDISRLTGKCNRGKGQRDSAS
jgi:membrane protein implicated in regulation of membrane protease activity